MTEICWFSNMPVQESIILWQRMCEDALFQLLKLGSRRPVWRLASVAMVKMIANGDSISVYSRASSLQGLLSDGRRADVLSYAGQCSITLSI